MSETITPARFIRETIFGIKRQAEFAELLGYEQPTISRFETGMRLSAEAQERILHLARARNIPFDSNWFWNVPDGAPRPRPRVLSNHAA